MYEYDSAGRVIEQRKYANSQPTSQTETVEFKYNNNGSIRQTLQTPNGSGTLQTDYQYYPNGSLKKIVYPEQGPLKPSIEYSYDKVGRIKTITATANEIAYYTTEYVYDKAGNVVKIIDLFEGETDFQIDEANRITQRTLPNNLLRTYDYKDTMEPLAAYQDKDNLVRSIDHTFGGTSEIQLTYQRKPGGEPQLIQRLNGDFTGRSVNLVYSALCQTTY